MARISAIPSSAELWTRTIGVLAALTTLTSCGGSVGQPSAVNYAHASGAVADIAVNHAASPVLAVSADVPAELVGDWSSAEGNAEIAYRFLADARFRSAQILNQLRPGGVFEFRVVQEGTIEVTGDQLVLRPTLSLKSLTDPDEPQRSYTDQPASLEAETFTWRMAGSALHLRGADGLELTFARQ